MPPKSRSPSPISRRSPIGEADNTTTTSGSSSQMAAPNDFPVPTELELGEAWRQFGRHNFGRDRHNEVSWEVVQRWWQDIVQHYCEPWRAYHTLRHICELFGLFQLIKHHLREPDVVFLAIIFHDIIYDPKAGDNEDRSAQLFKQYWSETMLSTMSSPDVSQNNNRNELAERARIGETVEHYIMATKHHTQAQCDPDSDLAYFLDMDLSILGAPTARYREYMRQIRFEYQHYLEASYRTGRCKVMEGFLKAPHLFRTDLFRERYETRSRKNIALEIRHWRRPPYAIEPLYFVDTQLIATLEQQWRAGDSHRLTGEEVQHCLAFANNVCFAARNPETKEVISYIIASVVDVPMGPAGTRLGPSPGTSLSASAAASLLAIPSSPTGRLAATGSPTNAPNLDGTPLGKELRQDHAFEGRYLVVHSIATAHPFRRLGFAAELYAHLEEAVKRYRASVEYPNLAEVWSLVPDTGTPGHPSFTSLAALSRGFAIRFGLGRSRSPSPYGAGPSAVESTDGRRSPTELAPSVGNALPFSSTGGGAPPPPIIAPEGHLGGGGAEVASGSGGGVSPSSQRQRKWNAMYKLL